MIEQETLLTNPFPGLRPFDTDENELFFGRDGQSDEVLSKLATSKFVAVVGTSGSGKSSLVRAGLLPALLSGHMPSAGSGWRVAIFRPGISPIANLSKALSETGVLGAADSESAEDRLSRVERALRRSSLGLLEVVTQARMSKHENLLILADQFEELFRFRKKSTDEHPEDEAAAFVRLLLETKQQGKRPEERLPIYVILTMRSDYLGDCANFWGLPEAINEGQYLIPRMNDDDRREAITGPIAIAGGEITAPLVNRLLNDAGDDPAQLPILQHALMRTWDYWKKHGEANGPIDLTHYDKIGSMAEALSNHADEAYSELSPELQVLAQKLFRSLTEKEADNREGRRPATVGEICSIAEAGEEQVKTVIEAFRREGRSFLMPPSDVPLTTDTLIDISHESLIRGWRRLRGWVDEEAQAARQYVRLADTAALYPVEQGFLRDRALDIGLRWLEDYKPTKAWAVRYHPGFDKTIEFLEASGANREAEDAERERERREKIERELKHARDLSVADKRRVKLRNWGLLILSLFLLMMLATTAYAVQQYYMVEDTLKQVEKEREIAAAERDEARRQKKLADDATREAAAERDEARRQKKLADNATREADNQRDIAKGALTETEKERDKARTAEDEAVQAKNSAVEARKEAERQKGAAVVALDALRQSRAAEFKAMQRAVADQAAAEAAKLTAEGLLTTVKEIDESAPYYMKIMRGDDPNVYKTSFSPDGNTVVMTGSKAKLWDWKEKEPTPLPDGKWAENMEGRSPREMVFSGSGKYMLATFDALPPDDNGWVVIWDVEKGTEVKQTTLGVDGWKTANEAVFSPDDKFIAFPTYSSSGGVAIAETNSGTIREFKGHTGSVTSIAFSPDSKFLETTSVDGTARVWNVKTGELAVPPLSGHLKEVTGGAFDPKGDFVVTGSKDGKAIVWNARTGDKLVELPGDEVGSAVRRATFSPDGKYILTVSGKKAFLWEAKTPGVWKAKVSFPNSPSDVNSTVLSGHWDVVNDAKFSPDGKWIVTISEDRTARVWRTESVPPDGSHATSRAVLLGHVKPLVDVDFSKDSKYVLTGSRDKTARVWDLTGIDTSSVAAVALKAEPSEYAGTCPITVKFSGTVTVEGSSGTVKYRFVRSDGTKSLVQELSYDTPGPKEVSESREMLVRPTRALRPPPISGWVEIEVLEPVAKTSNRADFNVKCENITEQQTSETELTAAQLKQIMPNSTDEKRALYLQPLRKAMEEFGIDTPLRRAAFLAEVGYNTADLRYLTEVTSGAAYEGRKDLGNVEPGDGVRFKGRGAFQVTGRSNYRSFGDLLGVDLISQPELVATPALAFRIAALYWRRSGLNDLADKADMTGIARRISGGSSGVEEQQQYFKRAREALGVAEPARPGN